MNKIPEKTIEEFIKFCDSMELFSQVARTFQGYMRGIFLKYLDDHVKNCPKCASYYKKTYNQTPEEFKNTLILEWARNDKDENKASSLL